MDRRSFLRASLATSALAGGGFGPGFWRAAYSAPAEPGPGPYGPLGEPDANGVRVPEGFAARMIAAAHLPVGALHAAPIEYVWHTFPDGGACYATDDGGWVYASNSEVPEVGGVGAVRFAPDGTVTDAYRILDGTSTNCAGGKTPWGTWLSCEEIADGIVWECDPFTPGQGVARPAMGAFAHEAVAVDPVNRQLYLTEDDGLSGFYRFTPVAYPDLSDGLLEVAVCEHPDGGAVTWVAVPDPTGASGRTAEQVPGANIFDGGEGIWFDAGFVYHTTKGDDRVWVYDTGNQRMFVLYAAADHEDPPLRGVDNVTVAPSGDLLVAEDGDDLEIVLISADRREVAPIMRLEGAQHRGSEIAGPAFNPDGSRLYFSSQRSNPTPVLGFPSDEPGSGFGVTFEITGPFRVERVGIAAVGASGAPEPMPSQPAASPSGSPSPRPSATGAAAPRASALPSTGAGLGAIGLGVAALGAAIARRGHAGPDSDQQDA